ncbi:MAG: hypothetical protein H7X88_05850 [Gloeobacteraceae cyanobacterium ES-bin-316]|nr:hypothetical protein [Ferruginibacter sp.]
MKHFILIFCIAGVSCCSTKTKSNGSGANMSPVEVPVLENVPSCLDQLIQRYTQEVKQNPARKIYSYTYKSNTVYYVTPPCCDFYSDLYDKDCNLIGHPDGGITGKGDGKVPDFEKEKSKEQLVWEDTRK